VTRVIIGGDVCPTGEIASSFRTGDSAAIFGDLAPDISGADVSIVNLECPLVESPSPIQRPGTILRADPKCINGLKAVGLTALNLANNHSFDHGLNGLEGTIATIRGAGIKTLGAGITIFEARKPLIHDSKDGRVVIYAMAEREFSVATETRAGANPLDVMNLYYVVKEFKRDGVFIVLLHGGKELYPYPTPEMVKKCRFMIDVGADAVISCHAHVPLPWEIYEGKPIIYGLGNLIFEPLRSAPRNWFYGYLCQLDISGGRVQFEALPYSQSRSGPGASKLGEEESGVFLAEMKKRWKAISGGDELKRRWREYCKKERQYYITGLLGWNRFMAGLEPILMRTIYSPKSVLRSLLLVQCETHQEALVTIFEELRKSLEN